MVLLAKVNPQFVNIPAGKFQMGSTQMEDAQPVETREISAFERMYAPVTVAQWKVYCDWGEETGKRYAQFIYGSDGRIAQTIWGSSEKALQKKKVSLKAGQFMGDIRQVVPTWEEYAARFNGIEDGARRFLGGDSPETCNKPAVMVDWFEAAAFCAAIGCELPTEAQKEYAARAGREGDEIYGTDSGELTAKNAHWDHDGSVIETADVRSYPPTQLGTYDETGNVWEWCHNWVSDNYEGWAKKDPAGPIVGRFRALRGGSWRSDSRVVLLAAYRGNGHPDSRYDRFGFRAVRP